MADILKSLRAAADETRLRILSVLGSEPLAVGEILEILGMGQSRISRHLKILADAGLLESHRLGNRVYYGLAGQSRVEPLIRELLDALTQITESNNGLYRGIVRDRSKLTEILELRKQMSVDHFQRMGREHDRMQQTFVDSSYYRREIINELGAKPGTVVDLGCGTGELSVMIARLAGKAIGVDQSPRVLELARSACPQGEFRLGEIEHLPLPDEGADAVVASMVLHHLPDPSSGLKEANRVLRKKGTLVVVDLKEHDEEAMQREFADFWPGFSGDRLEAMIQDAGFSIQEKRAGQGDGKLTCLIYRATKQTTGGLNANA
ncbi:MAG: metalloregulator ArsR/SmtB family transcription factor [Leptospirales bacterium]|nr:metalloregulator ArsR/SmtB family transcription factor [Leptospirales bacterium]